MRVISRSLKLSARRGQNSSRLSHTVEMLQRDISPSKAALVLAGLAAQLAHSGERPSPWSVADGWRLGAFSPSVFLFSDRGSEHRLEIGAAVEWKQDASGRLSAKIDGARLEGRVFFEELLARFPVYAVTGSPERVVSTTVAGIRSLPVVLAA